MANTYPDLDEKFIESSPSAETIRETFKDISKLIDKLHRFLKKIGVDYDDIDKIRRSKNGGSLIIHTSNKIAKIILDHEDETSLNIQEHKDGIKIIIE